MSLPDELEKLEKLRGEGALSEEDYGRAKEALLTEHASAGERLRRPGAGGAVDEKMWGMFIHLSQFCGYTVPLAGIIVPLVLWQVKKDASAVIDRHGRVVMNWVLTELIFGIVFGLLCMILIGIPFLLALCVMGVVFPIVGAVKANNGEVWPYPCAIPFFKLD